MQYHISWYLYDRHLRIPTQVYTVHVWSADLVVTITHLCIHLPWLHQRYSWSVNLVVPIINLCTCVQHQLWPVWGCAVLLGYCEVFCSLWHGTVQVHVVMKICTGWDWTSPMPISNTIWRSTIQQHNVQNNSAGFFWYPSSQRMLHLHPKLMYF